MSAFVISKTHVSGQKLFRLVNKIRRLFDLTKTVKTTMSTTEINIKKKKKETRVKIKNIKNVGMA